MTGGKKYICAFADKNLKPTLRRFGRQAKRMGVYDGIFLYNEDHFDRDFYAFFKEKLKLPRGFGYWVWKPQVILQTLGKLNDGDLLQYTDAGCHLNPKGLKRLNEYFEIVERSETGLLAFEMPWYTEKQYTKGDLFVYFGLTPPPLPPMKFMRDKWLEVFYL
jgi:hypothetical protein